MRVLQILTQTGGGPVDHAADVAVELAARGHESHLAGPDCPALERAERRGVAVHRVAMAHKADLPGAWRLLRLIRSLRPDVLHLQDRRAGLIGRLPGVATQSMAVVYTLHGVPESLGHLVAGNVGVQAPRRYDALLYFHAERWLATRSGGPVVVPSEPVAGYARDQIGLPSDQVRVVRNGVDADRFHPGPERPPHDALEVVWLGLMGPVKRVPLLLDVVDAVPQVRLTLLGDGVDRPGVEAAVDRRGLRDRVRLRGSVADPAPALREADLFVLPSAAENLPLALLQAMASGLPVVASRVGGIPDLVRDGTDGLLVAADRPEELVAAVRALAEDPERRHSLGRSARARVMEGFSVGACVDELTEVYAVAMSS